MTTGKTDNKILSLQGVRAIAFLLVFLLHTGITDTGEIGVSLFFVLSGFVFLLNYQNRSLGTSIKELFSFSFRKVKKLYVLHLLTMVAFLYFEIKILVENFKIGTLIQTIWHTVLNVLLLQVWSPQQRTFFSLNGVSWFLAVCAFLYFFFPLILKGIKNYTGSRQAIVAILITGLIMGITAIIATKTPVPESISNNFIKWFTYIFPVFRLGDFFIGCNLAYLYTHFKPTLKPVPATILELLSVGLMIATFFLRRYGVFIFGNRFVRYNLVYLPMTMFIVFIFAMSKGYISKFLSLKPFVTIGNLSPYEFLIHSTVIKYYFYITASLGIVLNAWWATIIIFVISVLLSYLYKYIADHRKRKS